jgi:hypothetical protein
MRSLTTNRQGTAVTKSTIATDIHQTLDVHLNALAEVALNLSLSLKDTAYPT